MAENIRDYKRLAHQIIDAVGKDNISQCTRCATRLRLVLKDEPAGMQEKVSELPGVITVARSGGQFQVVIGTHVGEVYDEAIKSLDLKETDQKPAKTSLVNKVIASLSGVFAPFVYILAGAGLLQGLLILINMIWPAFAETGTYEVLSFMSWTPFTYLPIFIGLTAARYFKTNELIAMLCCMALVNPDWGAMAARIADGESIQFLLFNLSQTTYTSSVLPPFFMVFILSYVEKFFSRHLHATFKALLLPLICFVIMVPLTLLVIGPISEQAALGLSAGYNWLVNTAPVLAGAVVGGLFQVMVIFGIHWGVTPLIMANFQFHGFDTFQAFQTAAICAQVGACFAVMMKTRNKSFKNMALSAGVTGLFGITEPIIYGVTLRLKKPFIYACIAGACGGIFIAMTGAHQYAYAGLPSLLTVVNAADPSGVNSFSLWAEIIGCVGAIVLAFILTWMLGFKDVPAADADVEEAEEEKFIPQDTIEKNSKKDVEVLSAVCDGNVIALENVEDPVFSSGAMGKGGAIEPDSRKICAPADGEIVMVFDTGHAVGMKTAHGTEILIHAGIDTVEMKGDGFDVHVKPGDLVKKGDLLLEMDLDKIRNAGHPAATMVLITNPDACEDVRLYPAGKIRAGEPFAAVFH